MILNWRNITIVFLKRITFVHVLTNFSFCGITQTPFTYSIK